MNQQQRDLYRSRKNTLQFQNMITWGWFFMWLGCGLILIWTIVMPIICGLFAMMSMGIINKRGAELTEIKVKLLEK